MAVGCGDDKDASSCLRASPVQKIITQQMPFLTGMIVESPSVPQALEAAF